MRVDGKQVRVRIELGTGAAWSTCATCGELDRMNDSQEVTALARAHVLSTGHEVKVSRSSVVHYWRQVMKE